MKRILFFIAFVLVSCSCGENKQEPEGTEIQVDPVQENYGTRVALQSAVTHVQPMTGIVLWNTSGSVKKSYVQLEYAYMLYSDVCCLP